MQDKYKLVRFPNGRHGIYSIAHAETCHPAVGPAAEAEELHVRQLRLPERLAAQEGEFVIWDVGLGGAANPLAALRVTQSLSCAIRMISFDNTLDPLRFALEHAPELEYLNGYERLVQALIANGAAEWATDAQRVHWEVRLADFPDLLTRPEARETAKPHAIFYDAFSPAKNPAMWTEAVFTNLFRLLDPERPCVLTTYSRSTLLRVTLLLAGFFAGTGAASGEKEETTVAANTLELIEKPLGRGWLERARKSTSAEPLRRPVYAQRPLTQESWKRLQAHPQFCAR